jgi:hypothetical protein
LNPYVFYKRVAWADFERGVRGTRAGRVHQLKQVSESEGPQASVVLPQLKAKQASPRETGQDRTRVMYYMREIR